MRKRKVNYPPARTATKRAPAPGVVGGAPMVRPTVATINMQARAGRDDIKMGDRVRIVGAGLYSGETAVVESVVGGVIPAALVRTDAGRSRRVRTVDLEPISDEAPSESAPPPETAPIGDTAET
ncbi:MAG: hypothetical protein M3432_06285 [Chloroflexota bacterium]|nr:hypothetical protein [Chloroflexota bacterium]